MMTTHHLEYHYLIKYFSSLLHTLKISIFSTGIGRKGLEGWGRGVVVIAFFDQI